MSASIIRFPSSVKSRLQNEKGKGCVICEVSDRYMVFSKSDNGYTTVNVFSRNYDGGTDRKLCSLVLCADELLSAINYCLSD